jgi:gag-polyprotein putative aspartyl protease
MKMTQFEIPDEGEVILIVGFISDKYRFKLAFDTAATHTTIDSNALFLSGYQLKDAIGETEIETSNGLVNVEIYKIKSFECLGIKKENVEIQVYDFMAHGVTSEYHGVLGLNFLKDHKFCIDMIKGEITID